MISRDRSTRFILRFWTPLAAQWVMMALEGPFLAAVIARFGDVTTNLAAYGIAYAFAILVEAPVIMLMSASTALVEDARSYRRLRNFSVVLNALSTGLLLLVLAPPVYGPLTGALLDLPDPVAERVYWALWILLPWPAAIGYRRFLHGVLIRAGQTRRVAYGTMLRLTGMAATAALLAAWGIPGAWIGAGALSAGVLVEAAAARWMAASTVRRLLRGGTLSAAREVAGAPEDPAEVSAGAEGVAGGEIATVAGPEPGSFDVAGAGYGAIARFYYPLALTSFIGLTVQPMLTFFMGRAPSPLESLAVFPVVHALSFLFRALGLSFQEAAIALLGEGCEHARELGRFALGLALAASAGLALVAYTPLARFWFETISGLPPRLASLALTPTQIIVPLPALSVLLAFQKALLVQERTTAPITLATAVEVGVIASLFPIFGWGMGFTGVTAAMMAFLGGRIASVAYLSKRTRASLARVR